VDLHQLELD